MRVGADCEGDCALYITERRRRDAGDSPASVAHVLQLNGMESLTPPSRLQALPCLLFRRGAGGSAGEDAARPGLTPWTKAIRLL